MVNHFFRHHQPFLILPSRFLLLALLLYVSLETLASFLMTSIPSLQHRELGVLLFIRLLELMGLIVLLMHFRLWSSLGLGKPNGMDIRIFLYISACCVAMVALLYAVQPTWLLHVTIPSWLDGLLGLILMVLIAPMVEEIVFRGLLYRMLREQWGIVVSVVVSSVFFSMIHQGSLISPQLAGGIIFALAYERSRSLWVPILLHMGANSAVYVLAVLVFAA